MGPMRHILYETLSLRFDMNYSDWQDNMFEEETLTLKFEDGRPPVVIDMIGQRVGADLERLPNNPGRYLIVIQNYADSSLRLNISGSCILK